MKRFLIILLVFSAFSPVMAQPQNVDKTIAVVGKYIILRSDLERELKSIKADNGELTDSSRCAAFEELLFQKLLVAQADKDSVKVKDEQVDAELDRRMNIFLQQIGSEEKFESIYGKSVKQYKEELRDDVRDLLVAQQMQSKIVGDIKVSPNDIRSYFNSLPQDSLPSVNTEIEICQLVKKPTVSEEAKHLARAKLEGYRQRVLNGESMSVIATLYTEDPGSAKTGGRYDNISRGMFMPQFEAVAFRLKPGEISEIFETPYGYHFIQLIARKGELVDVRHILVTPRVSQDDIAGAKLKLDSVYKDISEGKISFCDAVAKYTDDKETKNNCGIMVNSMEGTNRFEIDQLGQIDPNLIFMLDKMKVGEVSKSLMQSSPDGKQSFRLIYLKNRTEPHKINLKDDYQRLQNMAQSNRQKTITDAWINKRLKNTYVRLDPDYKNCNFRHKWLQANN
ncbi:MAG TPA: peptidylprolyl isomerase [Bacteroidia bacterium]|jgi:peptidyl-prolyl cis-trans isomerase SurA|nr:peptidylprolyl isomerase [Bacteroidia bacterium]